MTSTPAHTPTPYYHDGSGLIYAQSPKEHDQLSSDNDICVIAETAPADAEFIVRACNSYATMLEALQVAEAELEQHAHVPGVSEYVLPCVRSAAGHAITSRAT